MCLDGLNANRVSILIDADLLYDGDGRNDLGHGLLCGGFLFLV
jgi:hypothetical protein